MFKMDVSNYKAIYNKTPDENLRASRGKWAILLRFICILNNLLLSHWKGLRRTDFAVTIIHIFFF